MEKKESARALLSGDSAEALYLSLLPRLSASYGLSHAANLAERWLSLPPLQGALRAAGVAEEYITGDASDYEKLEALLTAAPRLTGHAALRWCQYDLAEQLGCPLPLLPEHCAEIWEKTARVLAEVSEEKSEILRPDAALISLEPGVRSAIGSLALRSDGEINDYATLLQAFCKELDDFCAEGGAYVALSIDPATPFVQPDEYHAAKAFSLAVESDAKRVDARERALFTAQMVRFFGRECLRRGLRLQLEITHTVPCNRQKMIQPIEDLVGLADLLSYLKESGVLPQTLLVCRTPEELQKIAPLSERFAAIGEGEPQFLPALAVEPCPDAEALAESLVVLAAKLPLAMLRPVFGSPVAATRDAFARVLCNLATSLLHRGEMPDTEAALAWILQILQ